MRKRAGQHREKQRKRKHKFLIYASANKDRDIQIVYETFKPLLTEYDFDFISKKIRDEYPSYKGMVKSIVKIY